MKRKFVHVRPARIQISLRIRTVWSGSSLCAFFIAKDARVIHADNENFDEMRPNVRKCTFGHVRPARIQISLRIRAVWSESSRGAVWIAKDANLIHADNKNFDENV